MNRRPAIKDFLTPWAIGGGIALAAVLLAAFWLGMQALRNPQTGAAVPTAEMNVIAAPTRTPVIQMPTAEPSPTATQEAALPPGNSAIAVGGYVQITGTGGDGLRLRVEPGTGTEPRFLGYDAEVFLVKDGPSEADGITWWLLEAPYDQNRTGWAASNYLSVIQQPANPTNSP